MGVAPAIRTLFFSDILDFRSEESLCWPRVPSWTQEFNELPDRAFLCSRLPQWGFADFSFHLYMDDVHLSMPASFWTMYINVLCLLLTRLTDNCISCHFCGWNTPCGTQIRLDYALWNIYIYICIFSWLNSWSGSHWAITILVHPMTLYGNTVSKNLLAYTWPVIDLIFSICRWFSIQFCKIILLYDIHFYSFPWHIIHLWALIDIYIYGDYLQLLIPIVNSLNQSLTICQHYHINNHSNFRINFLFITYLLHTHTIFPITLWWTNH